MDTKELTGVDATKKFKEVANVEDEVVDSRLDDESQEKTNISLLIFKQYDLINTGIGRILDAFYNGPKHKWMTYYIFTIEGIPVMIGMGMPDSMFWFRKDQETLLSLARK